MNFGGEDGGDKILLKTVCLLILSDDTDHVPSQSHPCRLTMVKSGLGSPIHTVMQRKFECTVRSEGYGVQ